jgi:hypothetical protein
MEVSCSFETLVSLYQTTKRHVQKRIYLSSLVRYVVRNHKYSENTAFITKSVINRC